MISEKNLMVWIIWRQMDDPERAKNFSTETIVGFTPTQAKAKKWIKDNTPNKAEWVWRNGVRFFCEPVYNVNTQK